MHKSILHHGPILSNHFRVVLPRSELVEDLLQGGLSHRVLLDAQSLLTALELGEHIGQNCVGRLHCARPRPISNLVWEDAEAEGDQGTSLQELVFRGKLLLHVCVDGIAHLLRDEPLQEDTQGYAPIGVKNILHKRATLATTNQLETVFQPPIAMLLYTLDLAFPSAIGLVVQ